MNSADVLIDLAELERFAEAVAAAETGALDNERFTAVRLQQGVYGQRQDGVHMVRIKIPGGRMTADQLRAVGDVTDRYADGHPASVTTRQDFQLHYIPLADTPAVLRQLAAGGLTTREACGNTVRNITGCSLAGICPREHTDIGAVVDATAANFLRHPLTQHLPRKFKMSFSGCEHDCAMGMMHDVGVVAVRRGAQHGFKVLAGGGLGHKPHVAVVVEEFISEQELLPTIEALIALHNRYSDRKRRAKARLKFLVDKFGVEGFREKYREELVRARIVYTKSAPLKLQWRDATPGNVCTPRSVFAQRQDGYIAVPIGLPLGDITAQQLRGLASLMTHHAVTEVRTTVDQNLLLTDVPRHALASIRAGIKQLNLTEPQPGDDVVSCPGTTTCRLGITSSKLIASKLSGGMDDLRVRVSGCHNSCGQHHVADIGLHGEGSRIHGKLVPSYVMHFGGNGQHGGAIALEGPTVPSQRAGLAIERVREAYRADKAKEQSFFDWARSKAKDYFTDLLHDLTQVAADEVVELARDYGEENTFRVVPLGGGECAGATQDFVASNFAEARHEKTYRNAFLLQRKFVEAGDCCRQMVQVVARALVMLAGQKASDNLPELIGQLRLAGGSADRAEEILAQVQHAVAAADPDAFSVATGELDGWLLAAGERCETLDSQVDLATALPELRQRRHDMSASFRDLSARRVAGLS